MKCLFPSDSIDINNNKYKSKLPRHIHRHYNSIKSNVSRHLKRIVTPFENIPDEIPSNHHQIKQLHHEFIRKWTDDARNIYAQNHLIHSSNTYSDQMGYVDLEKNRQKSTHRRHRTISSSSHFNNNDTSSSSSSSSLLNESYNNKTKEQASNSTSLSSIIENQSNIKQKNTLSNNSAIVYLKSKKPNDNIECKIS